MGARASMHRLDENPYRRIGGGDSRKKAVLASDRPIPGQNHKNFFVAKKQDSESTQSAFCWYRSVAVISTASR
jgi:hypothetical protein